MKICKYKGFWIVSGFLDKSQKDLIVKNNFEDRIFRAFKEENKARLFYDKIVRRNSEK